MFLGVRGLEFLFFGILRVSEGGFFRVRLLVCVVLVVLEVF